MAGPNTEPTPGATPEPRSEHLTVGPAINAIKINPDRDPLPDPEASQLGPADFESPFAGAMFSAATQPIPEPAPTSPPETPVPEVSSPSVEPTPPAKPGFLSGLMGMFRQK